MPIKKSQGFTLLEMAVVLAIFAALLGIMITPMSAQRESANIRKARAELADIEQALYGYAITNGALPCPTFPGMGGQALSSAGNCDRGGASAFHGFVPYQSLGLKGQVDCYGLLLDPWGQPYRYSVSGKDTANGLADFTTPGDIRAELAAAGSLSLIQPDIRICGDASSACNASTAAASLVADNIGAVAFSLGRHNQSLSATENENAGEASEAVSGACSASSFGLAADRFFYRVPVTEQTGNEFDDEFIWISPSLLYARMLAAGQLP